MATRTTRDRKPAAKKSTKKAAPKATAKAAKPTAPKAAGNGKRAAAPKGRGTLVIVESPTKARTIRNFLPPGYRVEASMGHVRDLPGDAKEIPAKYKALDWSRLGVNVEQDFEPLYIIPSDKKGVVRELKEALSEASELI